ncbi:MAG: hypothetical protein A2X86_14615 [Bdellovibrionales bacterium GWA2_49_15]|nr:MAG: hypothetical protein A2X86_14615 [Bdellovibrionales bacterium GWA2_49_15]HAZ13427.1 DNA-binding response regulator [Bdellovibrionales bacterium]
MQEAIQVFLVDDHPVFREGIKARLENEADFKVVGEAGDGAEALSKMATLTPDVMLLDIGLPTMNGLEVAKFARANYPRTEILVLTMHNRPEYAQRFLQLGVKGFVIKDSPAELLSLAIRQVAKGEHYIDERMNAPHPKLETEELSKREQEILQMLGQCSRNKDIAAKLGISVRTVEGHRRLIMKKMNFENIHALIRYVFEVKKN